MQLFMHNISQAIFIDLCIRPKKWLISLTYFVKMYIDYNQHKSYSTQNFTLVFNGLLTLVDLLLIIRQMNWKTQGISPENWKKKLSICCTHGSLTTFKIIINKLITCTHNKSADIYLVQYYILVSLMFTLLSVHFIIEFVFVFGLLI